MRPTQRLRETGQSLWLDNITRSLLIRGTLERYIDELSITGLTSNPTIFDHAITKSTDYDAAIHEKMGEGKSGERLFFALAIEDLGRAADLQAEGARSFVASWNELMAGIASKSDVLKKAG